MTVSPDFWVAVAAASPVIALAHAVSIGRYYFWQDSLVVVGRSLRQEGDARLAALRDFVPPHLQENQWPEEMFPIAQAIEGERNSGIRRGAVAVSVIAVAALVSVAGVVLSAAALLISLLALRGNRSPQDLPTSNLAISLVMVATGLVLLGLLLEATARLIMRRAVRPFTLPG